MNENASTPPTNAAVQNQEAKALIKELQAKYAVFRDSRPLAIGIDKQVLASDPGINARILRRALAFHTKSTAYLKSMSKATVRYDLEGQEGEAVTPEHRTFAQDLLRDRQKKFADQRKAEQIAQREQERRQIKLQALAEKFKR